MAVAAAARRSPPSFRTRFASRTDAHFRSLRPTTVTPPCRDVCTFRALGWGGGRSGSVCTGGSTSKSRTCSL